MFPEQPANCCFGHADGKTFFVRARTSLYRVRVNDSEITIDSKGNHVIRWSSLPNSRYAVYWSSDMFTWELAAEGVSSTGGVVASWTDPTAPHLTRKPERYYWIK